MKKEIHIFLDTVDASMYLLTTYADTKRYLEESDDDVIATTQICFLHPSYAERFFVHYKGIKHEVFKDEMKDTPLHTLSWMDWFDDGR